MSKKEDWSAWDKERNDYRERETEGFTKDLDALESHIKKLAAVCPKDKAGWPVLNALTVISRLQRDHARFKEFLNLGQWK